MAIKAALLVLNSGMVLDRSLLCALSAEDIASTITTIRGHTGARLAVVDNFGSFFTADNMIAKIKAKNLDYKLIAEHAKVTIDEDTIDAILKAEAAVNALNIAMKPKWNFQAVPVGWSFSTDVSFGATQVRRKRQNSTGEGTEYFMSPAQTEKLWLIASKRWANPQAQIDARFHAHNANRQLSVHPDRVAIGCQTLRRYELEQIAKHKGWAFPEVG